MAKGPVPVCLCLTGKTIGQNLEILEKYRDVIDLVELRADYLDPAEKFYIRSFPEKAGLPCILTVRRRSDGGLFEDGEGVRLVMIAKALSYARSDASANYAYVDLEDDFHMPAIEEACKTFGTRIIRSRHYLSGIPENFDAVWENLTQEEDEIPKLAVTPRNSAELSQLLAWASTVPQKEKLIIGMGTYGFPTRILAGRIGSHHTYTSPKADESSLAAPGQIDPESFARIYRGREATSDFDLYILLGGPSILNSLSPSLHNSAFKRAGKNAMMVPMPSDSIESALQSMKMLKAKGAAITVPLKEVVLPLLAFRSTDVRAIGACNTLVMREEGWAGYNSDADGFERSALEFLGRDDFSGLKVTIVGAGGAAKSVALSIFRKGGKAVILNRTLATARSLAKKFDFQYGPLDDRAIDLVSEYSDFIVQATSVGMQGGTAGDPLEFYEFDGHEAIFDLIYKPSKTALLSRAEASGCRIRNGYDMLRYQAEGQYKIWTDEVPPPGYYK